MREMGRTNHGFPEKSANVCEDWRNSGKLAEIARDRLKQDQQVKKSNYLGMFGVLPPGL